MPENETTIRNEQLNPQAAECRIGIRSLRTIRIYPLSIADQIKFTDILTKGLQEFVQAGDLEDVAFVSAVVELIKDNIGKLLSFVTDEDGESLLKELSNPQAFEVAEIIFDMNYGSVGKNLTSLAEKARKLFLSARPSPQSLRSTEDTDSTTSSESLTEKEDLQ